MSSAYPWNSNPEINLHEQGVGGRRRGFCRQACAKPVDDCPAVLTIQAGDYSEGALTINKPVTLEARNGTVYIH